MYICHVTSLYRKPEAASPLWTAVAQLHTGGRCSDPPPLVDRSDQPDARLFPNRRGGGGGAAAEQRVRRAECGRPLTCHKQSPGGWGARSEPGPPRCSCSSLSAAPPRRRLRAPSAAAAGRCAGMEPAPDGEEVPRVPRGAAGRDSHQLRYCLRWGDL